MAYLKAMIIWAMTLQLLVIILLVRAYSKRLMEHERLIENKTVEIENTTNQTQNTEVIKSNDTNPSTNKGVKHVSSKAID